MKFVKKSFKNFIIPEIPNLIQIIGTTSIFSVIALKIIFLGLAIPIFVNMLLFVYLLHKSSIYLGSFESICRNGWNYKLLLIVIVSIVFSSLILIGASYE